MTDHTLMSDYLEALGVPHTDAYANRRFATMPFSSVFGLKKLLEEYGVDSEAFELADKAGIREADTPFLAQMPVGDNPRSRSMQRSTSAGEAFRSRAVSAMSSSRKPFESTQ